MDAFLKDLKHSFRLFLDTPGVTIAAIAALPLGIATLLMLITLVATRQSRRTGVSSSTLPQLRRRGSRPSASATAATRSAWARLHGTRFGVTSQTAR